MYSENLINYLTFTIMTGHNCAICLQDCSAFSKLDLSQEVEMISLTTHIWIDAGETGHYYHTVCLSRAMKDQTVPINPANRVPLKPELVKHIHKVMDLLEIPHPPSSDASSADADASDDVSEPLSSSNDESTSEFSVHCSTMYCPGCRSLRCPRINEYPPHKDTWVKLSWKNGERRASHRLLLISNARG